MSRRSRTLRVATYNVHRCRGMDARTVPQRIASVLADLDADAIALQEVLGASQRRPGQAAELGAALGMGWVMAPTRHLRGALYGNVVLSRLPIRQHVPHDLSWKTCEPRGVQRVDLALDDEHILHLYNVHLGTALARTPRSRPTGSPHLDPRPPAPAAPRSCSATSTSGRAASPPTSCRRGCRASTSTKYLKRRRTYPGFFPLLHLDHIYYEGRVEVRHVELVRNAPGADGLGSPAAGRRPHRLVLTGLRPGRRRPAPA